MPELSIEYYYHCRTAEYWNTTVKGSTGDTHVVEYGPAHRGPYQHDWNCTCKGFKYRRTCKHIEEAKKKWCGWDQFIDGGQPVKDENGESRCPKCGNHVISQGHGV